MPGATLQLVSHGSQDMYLTGNPQITFFKIVYRRHTNFSMEDIIIRTITKPYFGGQVTQKISKLGDLVHKISLIYKAQKVYAGHGLANPTTALIDYIGLVIGGHEIDRQYGHWMETWYELTKPNPNGTCTNITKIDDNSISHMASNLDVGISDGIKKNAVGLYPYFDNRLNKLTNIMGTGISYPPTKFQKSSRCGGCYCEPTYLQELEMGWDELNDAITITSGTRNTVGTTNMKTYTADAVGRGGFESEEVSDYTVSVNSIVAQDIGGSGSTSAKDNLTAPLQTLVTPLNIMKAIATGSIIGLSVLEIPFYCGKDPGLSLPLIAMQNQEIQLDIHFAGINAGQWTKTPYTGDTNAGNYIAHNGTNSNVQNCFNAFATADGVTPTALLNPIRGDNSKINFDIDISILYIYLDTDERRRFAQVSHEYLIEQVQYLAHTSTNTNIDISAFSHPVKEIIWTGQPYKESDITYATVKTVTDPTNTSLNNGTNAHKSGVRFQPGHNDNISGGSIKNSSYTLGFGNEDINASKSSSYTDATIFSSDGKFVTGLLGPSTPSCLDNCDWSISLNDIERTTPQPLQQYTRNNVERYHSGYGSVSCPDSIAVYSFALKPEEHQPSGTCNFSKVDKVMINRYKGQTAETDKVKLNIYAINYNILRVMSGMAALAYTL
jgi:hypothetical protein